MKNLYNIVQEGILDITNGSLDHASNNIKRQKKKLILEYFKHCTYDEKTSTLSSDQPLYIKYNILAHKIYVDMYPALDTGVDFEIFQSLGFIWDGNLNVTTKAINECFNLGIKLSSIPWVGKNHYLNIIGSRYVVDIEKRILDFLDCDIDNSTELYFESNIKYNKLLSNSIFNKFAVIYIKIQKFIVHDYGLSQIRSSIKNLCISNCIYTDWSPSINSLSPEQFHYDYAEWFNNWNDDEKERVKDLLEKFLKNNPKTKLLVNYCDKKKIWVYVYFINGEVKMKPIIRTDKSWEKIRS